MPLSELSAIPCGDTLALFLLDAPSRQVGLELIPAALADRRVARRANLAGEPFIDAIPGAGHLPAHVLDPLVHLKLLGDSYTGGFAQGRTMRGSPSNRRFAFVSQETRTKEGRTTVVTALASREGLRLEHLLTLRPDAGGFELQVRLINASAAAVTLEMLTSFALSGLSPFLAGDAAESLRVHRFRSAWSAEGRHDVQTLEQLHLERSWSGSGVFSERFGQVGSMPVRGWFPFVAVEDVRTGVCWGAQLAWAGSWQMEIARQHDDVCLSGGLADRELGHWTKTLAPGEAFLTPPAHLACVQGTLDDLCDRLTAFQQPAADAQPAVEQDLPVVFNEWCTTWGNPSHERIAALARTLAGTGVRYLVIDAGWYRPDSGHWDNSQGDWIPSRRLFPHGLEATAAAIRDQGLIPGLWFEMEVVGRASTAFSMTGHLLQRDGMPLTVGQRRFWDLCDPYAVDYLSTRVIDLLARCGFGYLKVDYNETIGIGCAGESPGEGLRRQIEGVYRLFDRIRARLPELVIENCASGGHRSEPSMLARTAMTSFSDAHELVEIPLIAATLQRLVLPRQSQVWAVLHAADPERRLVYLLAGTFLGRMCLSGEIDRLSAAQRALVLRSIALYRKAAPVIKRGISRRSGNLGPSWRHPRGWQAVTRTSLDGSCALVVAHGFADAPAQVTIDLPPGLWCVEEELRASPDAGILAGNRLLLDLGDFTGRVVLLSRLAG